MATGRGMERPSAETRMPAAGAIRIGLQASARAVSRSTRRPEPSARPTSVTMMASATDTAALKTVATIDGRALAAP